MSKIVLLGKILVLIAFFAGLFVLAKHAQMIRKTIATQFGMTQSKVAGAKTSLEQEMKKDIAAYVTDVKDDALNVKVSDIIKPFLQARKIGKDLTQVKDLVVSEVEKRLK